MIRRPATILALLTALNFLNYVDRYLVNAVSPRFEADLGLTHTMTGFVVGAFMLGYFLTSPFFGRLSDRYNPSVDAWYSRRPVLIFIGITVWSLATIASGFAIGAKSLIAARIAVGIGEASYATIAPTIIDDIAPAEKKNRWLAIFYLAIPVGSAIGYMLGGQLEKHFGWRSAFFVAGAPGLVLAFTVLFVKEARQQSAALSSTRFHLTKPSVPPADLLVEPTARSESGERAKSALQVLRRAPLYRVCVYGICMYTFAIGGFAAWAPAFVSGTQPLTLSEADLAFGAVLVVGGIAGTAIGSFLADRVAKSVASEEGRVRAYLRFSAVATAIAVPAAVATLLARSSLEFFIAIFFCETALFASTSPINVVILGSVPATLRATAMGISIFAMHAFGDFPSPPLIGRIADRISLRAGLSILPLTIALAAFSWWMAARLPLVETHDSTSARRA
ncbi:MAG: MFS transporter [Polyangiales bacterium]